MLRLNAGCSRKVGEPNYGSRGASLNIELEVESNLIGNPEALMDRIREVFRLAQRSVDQELKRNGAADTDYRTPTRKEQNQGNSVRPVTSSQCRAIRAICRQQQVDADRLVLDVFGVSAVEELTIREASSLIDDLKSTPASRNGGRR